MTYNIQEVKSKLQFYKSFTDGKSRKLVRLLRKAEKLMERGGVNETK